MFAVTTGTENLQVQGDDERLVAGTWMGWKTIVAQTATAGRGGHSPSPMNNSEN